MVLLTNGYILYTPDTSRVLVTSIYLLIEVLEQQTEKVQTPLILILGSEECSKRLYIFVIDSSCFLVFHYISVVIYQPFLLRLPVPSLEL